MRAPPIRTFCTLLLLLSSVAFADERPKLLVLDLGGAGGVGADVGAALSEAIAQEISRRGYFDAIGAAEIRTLIGVERQKQLGGCNEGESCQAEIAGSLGARFVLSGTLAKLGDTYQLTLQTLDTSRAQPLARATRIAKSVDALREQLPWTVAEATGTPLPPEPSKLVPYSLMGGGALVVATGAVIGISAITQASIANQELVDGSTGSGPIHSLNYYKQQDASISTQKSIALAAVVIGAAAIAGGVWTYRRDSKGDSISVAFAPAPSGGALVGVFP
ncbi:MAG: hypothetical protein ACJ790_12520 [Myxococcaceae bacterium]